MQKTIIHILFFTILCSNIFAQGIMLSEANPAYDIVERLAIKSAVNPKFHIAIRYYTRSDVVNYALEVLKNGQNLKAMDFADLNFIFLDNVGVFSAIDSQRWKTVEAGLWYNKKALFNYFYKNKADFFRLDKKGFQVDLNPIIDFKLGKDFYGNQVFFRNTRGVRIRGSFDNKIYFYSSFFETQANFFRHIDRKIQENRAIPGNGFHKSYISTVFNDLRGYDYSNAQAYIAGKISRHIDWQFGQGRFFIGNGIRSLLLSDYSHNYLYLKLNTRIWKIQYQNIFAELSPVSANFVAGDNLLPKKYMATHYLSFKLSQNATIGLFETIIFNRSGKFELQYLNPIIIYRTVEQSLGSADNVLLGIDFKINLLRKFSLYSQLILDEFQLYHFKKFTGWWGNKYGFQFGMKYIDVAGIDHLDLQFEGNIVRPYTYSHRDSTSSYSHYNMPLAHPLGANFRELIIRVKYKPIYKLLLEADALFTRYGDNPLGENWGGNILLSSDSRVKDEGNTIGQGISSGIAQFRLSLSYQIYPNYFFDLKGIYRNQMGAEGGYTDKLYYFASGFRINIAQNKLDY